MRLSFCALALLLALPLGAEAKKVKLKLTTVAPKNSVFHKMLKEVRRDWKKLSDGQVSVKIYAGGVAGDDYDVIRKMRLGTLQGGLLMAGGLSTIDKGIHALSIPMAFKDFGELDYVVEALTPKLNALYEEKGFIVLTWVDAGWVRFLTKTPAKAPKDFADLKLFVGAGQPEVAEIWKQVGFNPVLLPTTEISTGLQTGLITALNTTPQAANLLGWYTHAPNMTNVIIAPMIMGLVVYKDAWEKIDAPLQAKLKAAAIKAGERFKKRIRPQDKESLDAMIKRGLNLVEPTAADLVEWEKLISSKPHVVRGEYVSPEFYDEAIKLRDAYRAKR
ncbi:TRAP transporter substrate-binding protein DctP [Myxococcota bacterium]|nr:TRAP transporter substrate-binding protein DctP [Myxococcota bacterium]MBU1432159.1 TRAP transporter substrate-binding protein DctP [Myxococcota bacterium]MBU1899707.1 TRAP transporter substrate-binding protein DctP [Myxococcota bacterium]